MAIETGVAVTVYADHDYSYVVHATDEIWLEYVEDNTALTNRTISFGSLDEMEAVAKAMLSVVQFARTKP